MSTIAMILKWLILLPILIAVAFLAVANDHLVTLHLNPFDTGDPVMQVRLPLYAVAFAAFALGGLIGGAMVWLGQYRYRWRARHNEKAAEEWRDVAIEKERQQIRAPLLSPPSGR